MLGSQEGANSLDDSIRFRVMSKSVECCFYKGQL